MQDCLEEDRLADAKYGSTRRGIAPVYGDKYMKKGIRIGDLLQPQALEKTAGRHFGLEKPDPAKGIRLGKR